VTILNSAHTKPVYAISINVCMRHERQNSNCNPIQFVGLEPQYRPSNHFALTRRSNTVSNIFIGSIELNEEREEMDFKWELTGLAKAVTNEELNQTNMAGEVKIKLKSGKPIHNVCPLSKVKCFDGEGNCGDKSQVDDSLPPLVFRPNCDGSSDNDSDFEDDNDLVPNCMPRSATEIENADDDSSLQELCFTKCQDNTFFFQRGR
jgi:hypothetical protein